MPRKIVGTWREEISGGWGKHASWQATWCVPLVKYYCGDQITEDGSDEACSTHRRELNFVQDLVRNLKERARFVDLAVGGKITFKRILNK
jgi:hypothetical protein